MYRFIAKNNSFNVAQMKWCKDGKNYDSKSSALVADSGGDDSGDDDSNRAF